MEKTLLKGYGIKGYGRAAALMAAAVLLNPFFLTACGGKAPSSGEQAGEVKAGQAPSVKESGNEGGGNERGGETAGTDTGPFQEEAGVPAVLVNREGYRPGADKEVIFRAGEASQEDYEVVDAGTGETVYKGDIDWTLRDTAEGEASGFGNFKYVTTPGTYFVRTGRLGSSYPFVIGESRYGEKADEALRLFHRKRCGHGETVRLEGTDVEVDVGGGWHDGDGKKRVATGCRAAATLMLAYRLQPEKFGDALGIPESGNGIPDILDEARFEAEWILKMQARDGGIYALATEDAVYGAQNAATAAGAAVLAMCSGLYGEYDGEFSARCLTGAKRAWNFLEKNAGKTQPDGDDGCESYFAAAELYRLTGERKYRKAAEAYISHDTPVGLGVGDMGAFGTLAYLTTEKSTDVDLCGMLMNRLLNEGNVIEQDARENPYRVSGEEYLTPESDMQYLNNCIILIYTNRVNPDDQLEKAIGSHVNFFLGCNPEAKNYLNESEGYGPDTTDTAWNAALVFVLSYMR